MRALTRSGFKNSVAVSSCSVSVFSLSSMSSLTLKFRLICSKSGPAVYHLALLCFLWAGGLSSSFGTPTNIFSTQFESAQGYDPNLNLAGQNGWTKYGSGGNGLTNGFFSGQAQQAYVGRFPPAPGDGDLFVWHPINFSPVAANLPLLTFTTLMKIIGPSNGQ